MLLKRIAFVVLLAFLVGSGIAFVGAEVAKKSPAPASGTSVKPEEPTFELIKSIKFADGTEVKSIAKVDIEALRDLPVDMGKNKNDGAILMNKQEKLRVHTCREYDSALEAGYYPSTSYEVTMAAFFKYPCETLSLLEIAKIPQQSFIPKSKEGVFDLTLLPLSMFPVMSDYEQKYGFDIANVTYQDRVEKGLLKVTDRSQGKLKCEDDGLRQHLTEVVRADFNGDDIEDVLFYEAVYAIGGLLRVFHVIILTRKSMGGKYEEIELHDSE